MLSEFDRRAVSFINMHCDLDSSIPDWIIDHPATAGVFDRLGIDVSCGGKSLEYLCRKQGLDPVAVLLELRQVAESSNDSNDGSNAT